MDEVAQFLCFLKKYYAFFSLSYFVWVTDTVCFPPLSVLGIIAFPFLSTALLSLSCWEILLRDLFLVKRARLCSNLWWLQICFSSFPDLTFSNFSALKSFNWRILFSLETSIELFWGPEIINIRSGRTLLNYPPSWRWLNLVAYRYWYLVRPPTWVLRQ